MEKIKDPGAIQMQYYVSPKLFINRKAKFETKVSLCGLKDLDGNYYLVSK